MVAKEGEGEGKGEGEGEPLKDEGYGLLICGEEGQRREGRQFPLTRTGIDPERVVGSSLKATSDEPL